MDEQKKLLQSIQDDFFRFTLMHDYYQPDDMDVDKFFEELQDKIEKYQSLLTPGTDEYEKSEMMKGFAIIQLTDWNKIRYELKFNQHEVLKRDIEKLEALLERTEPVKLKKNGFMLYFDTLMALTFQNRAFKKFEASRAYAKKAEVLYELYRATNPELPTHRSEFAEGEAGFDRDIFDWMKYQIGFINWQSYEDDQDACPVKYPIAAIKWILHLANLKYEGSIIETQVFQPVYHMIATLIYRRYFKQVDHTLAVLWSFSVKFRKQLKPEKRVLANSGQGLMAQLFARWAHTIWMLSIESILNPNITVNNDVFEELNEPGDEDYKQYLGQFPIEPTSNFIMMKKIYKKGLAWKKRTDEMCTEPAKIMALDLAYMSMKLANEQFLDNIEQRQKKLWSREY